MASPIFNPFSFNPANTGRASGSYTVPAGKYAYVVIHIMVEANVSQANGSVPIGTVGNGGFGVTSEANSDVIQLWLDEGDAITSSGSNASGTATVTGAGSTNITFDSQSASTSMTVNLGGSAIAICRALVTASFMAIVNTLGPITYGTFSGGSSCYITYAEYNKTT